jgi:competence protein ComEC
MIFIYEKYMLQTTNEFIVFNKTKTSIIGIRNGKELKVYTTDKKLSKNAITINSYLVGTGVKNVEILPQTNLYSFNTTNFLRLDSLGLYPLKFKKPLVILLQNSPKINLERLLNILHPTSIITDGSNFRSYGKLWRETCIKNKTPFYNTMQKGAFIKLN